LLPVIHPLVLRLSSPSDKSRIRFHAARSCLDSSGSCPVTGLSYAQESNTAAGVLTFLYHGHVTRHCSTSIRLLHCLTPLHFMQPISTQFCIRRGSSCPSHPSPSPLAKGRNLPRPPGAGEYSPTWFDLGSPSCLQTWEGAMDGRVQRESRERERERERERGYNEITERGRERGAITRPQRDRWQRERGYHESTAREGRDRERVYNQREGATDRTGRDLDREMTTKEKGPQTAQGETWIER